MRGRKNKRRETGRVARRYVLAGLLVASSQAAIRAESPVITTPVPLSPLPLFAGERQSAGVALNPFCQPAGLKSPRDVDGNAGLAPLLGSRSAGNVIRPFVVAAHEEQSATLGHVVRASGEELRPVARLEDGGMRSYLQPVTGGQVSGGIRANPLSLAGTHSTRSAPVMTDSPHAKSVAVAVDKDTPESASGPVSFSLSDDADEFETIAEASGLDELGSDDAASEPHGIGPVVRPAIDSDETVELRPKSRPVQTWRGDPSRFPEPVTIHPTLVRGSAAGKPIPVPLAEEVGEAGVELEPLESHPVEDSRARLVNGGHRRVEVGRPPVAVDRLATTSLLTGKPRLLVVETDSGASQTGVIEKPASQPAVYVASPPRDPRLASESPTSAVETQVTDPDGRSLLVPAVESGTSGQVSPVGVSTDKRPNQSSDIAGASPPGPTSVSEVSPKLATAQPGIADQPRAVQEPEVFVSRLRLKPTEVRSLKLDRPIGSALSDDLKVCAVIRTGQSQIQLIATGEGTAKLSVITAGEDGKEDVENYEVIVGDMRTSQVESPEATAATLTQTARSAFPGSEVTVDYRSGRLVVTGSVADEGSARRLLRMIRSACSMPVDDKLMVR
jgi:hypothetical protein